MFLQSSLGESLENTFSCEADSTQFASCCCTCTFPPPCFCSSCSPTHCSKSGSHYLLPITARQEITSERDLDRVRYKLNQLHLAHTEMNRVIGTFTKAKEEVEAMYMEITHLLAETKGKYVAMLKDLEALCENNLNLAMQDCYSNAWKKDFQPVDPLTELVWTYNPGEATPFHIYFSAKSPPAELIEKIYQVQWTLSLPTFPSYPEDAFPLSIVLDSGQEYAVIARPGLLLRDLKETALLQSSIPLSEAYFYNETGVLEEDMTVHAQGLSRASTLHLTANITINVLEPNWENRSYSVRPNITIRELIELIPEEPLLAYTKHVLYESQWLDPNQTLAYYSITTDAHLQVISYTIATFPVYIHCESAEKTLNLEVNGSDTTISQVKDMITASEHLQSVLYSLTFHGHVLQEELSLAHYSIVQGSTLGLLPRGEREVEVEMGQSKGKTILRVNLWGKVWDVKAKCGETDGKLMVDGEEMENERILASYSIHSGSTLHLLSPRFKVYIRLLSGRTFPLEVTQTDSISLVKEKIEVQEDIPRAVQQLWLPRGRLEDTKTISDYGITAEMTIRLLEMKPTNCEVS